MKTECNDCTYGYSKQEEQDVLLLQCLKCENIDKWNELDLKEQNLIMLYDVALENKKPELARDTFLELIKLDIQDITVPNNI